MTVVIVTIATVALVRFFFSQFEFSRFVTPQHLDNRPLSGQLFEILAMFCFIVVELVGGGSVINGATMSSFKKCLVYIKFLHRHYVK